MSFTIADGIIVGSAENGADFTCELSAGTHNITINQMANPDLNVLVNTPAKTNTRTIVLTDDMKQVEIELEVVWRGLVGTGEIDFKQIKYVHAS